MKDMKANAATGAGHRKPAAQAAKPQVAVPEKVALPLPKKTRQQIAVPASINGRDLSTGRL